jgi:dihydrofolate synthase/folylpolyglutamate synthase
LKAPRARSFDSLDDWLPWLESLSPREIVLGLDRVLEVIGRLGPGRPGLVINVAGTNGKGSCVAMLESLLRVNGIRTGCYTSPHLVRYNERIRIDGEAADDGAVMAALESVEAVRRDVPLTFFEFGTLAALRAFSDAGVDAWVLEVGMGGRLDAVNAVEPDSALITNVALDHCAWLGDDVESIAREKAAVMRPSKPAVFGARDVPRAVREHADAVGADLRLAGRDFGHEAGEQGRWSWHGRRLALPELVRPALAGAAQLDNASAVLGLLEALGRDDLLDAGRVREALAAVKLAGRFQRIGNRWIVDVAHNPAAGRVLSTLLADMRIDGGLTAIVGMLGDKDVEGFVEALAPTVDDWVAVAVGSDRSEPADALARRIANATGKPCRVADSIGEAIAAADARAGADDRILVTGSFHTAGPALELLAGD